MAEVEFYQDDNEQWSFFVPVLGITGGGQRTRIECAIACLAAIDYSLDDPVTLDELERSLIETAHLMRSPANARRLSASVERIERGEFEEHDLIDPDGE